MNTLWAVALVGVAFVIVMRLRGRRKRLPKVPVYSRRIEGYQVVASLAPDMSARCLFDHGVQFGKGFRRKEGPALPHDGRCHCASVRFSFTSNEVFNGALRSFAEVHSDIPGLPQEAAGKLLEQLKRVESAQLPPSREAYKAAVEMDEFPGKVGDAVAGFLDDRYEFLSGENRQGPRALPDAGVAAEN